MPDLEEFHCELCDCTFEVRIVLCDCTFEVRIVDENDLEINCCPLCGEPLDADEL